MVKVLDNIEKIAFHNEWAQKDIHEVKVTLVGLCQVLKVQHEADQVELKALNQHLVQQRGLIAEQNNLLQKLVEVLAEPKGSKKPTLPRPSDTLTNLPFGKR